MWGLCGCVGGIWKGIRKRGGFRSGDSNGRGIILEGWVVGEDPEELWVEDHTDGRVLIMFVE